MKKVDNINITRLETECFYIDIVENKDSHLFEAWLQGKDYGVSTLMFGYYAKDFDGFCEIVEENLSDYIYDYYREYCDGQEV